MKRILPALLMLLAIGQQALAVTNVSGIITGVTTFTKANSPYVVSANLLVDEGATLVIEPGTEVRVDGWVKFYVDGSIKAIGTATDPIIFKSTAANPTRESWYGIAVRNVGAVDSSAFAYCNFTSALFAIEGEGIYSVTHCTATECYQAFKIGGPHSFVISDNIVKHCTYGIEAGALGVVSSNEVAHTDFVGIKTFGNVSVLDNYVHDAVGGIGVNGAIEIAHNKVVNTRDGSYGVVGNVLAGMHHNLSVHSGGIGYYLAGIPGGIVEHNTSIYDNIGLRIEEQQFVFKDNCITLSTTYLVKVAASSDVDISGNYWGTTDTAILNAKMFDYYDDYVSPKGTILPALTQPGVDCQSYTGPWVTSVADATPKTIAVTVSPNPFVNSFVIDLHGQATELTVFNKAGQRIVSLDANGKNKLEVDMSAYPAGMYHYRVSFADQPAVAGKLIKQ